MYTPEKTGNCLECFQLENNFSHSHNWVLNSDDEKCYMLLFVWWCICLIPVIKFIHTKKHTELKEGVLRFTQLLFKKEFFSSFPADNGSTLSSEAITDSATSTDNNYGYMGMELLFFWPVTVSLQYISVAWLAGRLLQTALIPHWFSMCFCLSGQEPFKRRPILNHLHHLAIHIGDALPYNRLNQFWDLQQTNQPSMNHTSMTCSC